MILSIFFYKLGANQPEKKVHNMSQLTLHEFASINCKLKDISDTWSDLWVLLHILPVGIGRVVSLRYGNLIGDSLVVEANGRFEEKILSVPAVVRHIVQRRRDKYPHDVYVFQSHSNRVKFQQRPVTVIAFNQALKIASKGVTDKVVSSKSARW